MHLPHSTVPTIILIMTVIVIFAMPLFGALSDRIGRKPVFLASAAAFVVSPFVWFLLFQTRNYGLMLLGFLFVFLTYAASFATFPAFFSLAFPTNVRYTGAAVSVNIGAALGGSLAPLLSAALFEATGSWVSIAIYISAVSALSVIAGVFLRELPDPAPAPAPSVQPSAAHPGER
ncbi:hypothetical protein DMP23_16560 [Amycolatopsis sp. A1MSW2902]|uniref:MFS transporter n=1 Tax=Amycolatopsis sp. A1MSW2902 TaxID=687413 RepID=UPI00307DF14A